MKPCWKADELERPSCENVARLIQIEVEKQCPNKALIPQLENDTDLRLLPKDDKSNLRVIKNFTQESSEVYNVNISFPVVSHIFSQNNSFITFCIYKSIDYIFLTINSYIQISRIDLL